MSGFAVWYVLSLITIEHGKLVSGLSIHLDLPSCQHAATRAVAADPNARWLCHEMTTEVKGQELFINFPEGQS